VSTTVISAKGEGYGFYKKANSATWACLGQGDWDREEYPNGYEASMFLASPMLMPMHDSDAKLTINGSNKLSMLLKDPEEFQACMSEQGLGGNLLAADTYVYGMWNGKELSPLVEICNKAKMMSGDVGLNIGYATGAAIKCPKNKVPRLDYIVELMKFFEYKGEFTIGITDGNATAIRFGHEPPFMSMYLELTGGNADRIVEFFVLQKDLRLFDTVAISVLITRFPFPVNTQDEKYEPIKVDSKIGKHIYEERTGNDHRVIATAYGDTLREARRRVERTLTLLVYNEPTLQYRNDVGRNITFRLVEDIDKIFSTPVMHEQPVLPASESVESHQAPEHDSSVDTSESTQTSQYVPRAHRE